MSEVHPHACGENHFMRIYNPESPGPPPRVWGKLGIMGLLVSAMRSTPTRVGKTRTLYTLSLYHTVHPHACGENVLGQKFPALQTGPPPRVWGKLLADYKRLRAEGSTPTRVGKT